MLEQSKKVQNVKEESELLSVKLEKNREAAHIPLSRRAFL